MYFKKLSEEQYLEITMTYGLERAKFWTEGFDGYVTIEHDNSTGTLRETYATFINGIQIAGILRDHTFGNGDGYYITTFCNSATFTNPLKDIIALADKGHIQTSIDPFGYLYCEGLSYVS